MLETCHCCITCPKREAEAQARLATESRCHGRIVVSMNPIDGQPLSAIAHTDSVNIPLVFETVHGMYQACGSLDSLHRHCETEPGTNMSPIAQALVGMVEVRKLPSENKTGAERNTGPPKTRAKKPPAGSSETWFGNSCTACLELLGTCAAFDTATAKQMQIQITSMLHITKRISSFYR